MQRIADPEDVSSRYYRDYKALWRDKVLNMPDSSV
jgi:hypothetical protein